MILSLFRGSLLSNLSKPSQLWTKLASLENWVSSNAHRKEAVINKGIFDSLGLLNVRLDPIKFKGQVFYGHVKAEKEKSHGKICQMILPSRQIGTELGDLFLSVDHILVDSKFPQGKVITGMASVIQTKKEKLAVSALSHRQLYLMTFWPQFKYKGLVTTFHVLPDIFSFYLFILDPSKTSKGQCLTSVASAPMVMRWLGLNKSRLLADIRGSRPPLLRNYLNKERINNLGNEVPFNLTFFLLKALFGFVGSHSMEVRSFLKQMFFQSLEDIEDCELTLRSRKTKRKRQLQNYDPVPSRTKHDNLEQGDEDLYAVRLKIILRTER